jgi:hypothetical protein
MSPPSSGSKNKQNKKGGKLCCFHAGFLAWLTFRPWRWMRHVPPKHRLTFNRLYSVMSQRIGLFTTTAVRISNFLLKHVNVSTSRLGQLVNLFLEPKWAKRTLKRWPRDFELVTAVSTSPPSGIRRKWNTCQNEETKWVKALSCWNLGFLFSWRLLTQANY